MRFYQTNMIDFQVSVIILVYDTTLLARQALAIALEEVGEVLLIKDKSPDDVLAVLAICQELNRTNIKVRLYQHPIGITG
jgi:hypothetical protein